MIGGVTLSDYKKAFRYAFSDSKRLIIEFFSIKHSITKVNTVYYIGISMNIFLVFFFFLALTEIQILPHAISAYDFSVSLPKYLYIIT